MKKKKEEIGRIIEEGEYFSDMTPRPSPPPGTVWLVMLVAIALVATVIALLLSLPF
jgi:hypothetical protein